MNQFEYKMMFTTHKLLISKEIIEHNGKTIPSQEIKSIGIELVNLWQITAKQVFRKIGGGLVGGLITGGIGALTGKGNQQHSEKINKDNSLKNLPNSRGQLIIHYKPSGSEESEMEHIQINSADPICRKMLEKVAEIYKEKFLGYGNQIMMEEKIGTETQTNTQSKNDAIAIKIMRALLILLVLGFIGYSILVSLGYAHF